MKQYKNLVYETLRLLEDNNFVKDKSLITGFPVFYKLIFQNIYVLLSYANSESKDYSIHCFDLYISYSDSLEDLRKENKFSDFQIYSFNINDSVHFQIFNELMYYGKEMQCENHLLFEMLDNKYYEIYFGKKKSLLH